MAAKQKPAGQKELSAWQKWSTSAGAEAELMQAIATGTSLNRFITDKGFVYNTVRNWIDATPDRAAKYARAREDRADYFADEIVAIGDESSVEDVRDQDGEIVAVRFDAVAVARNKLRIDARKWVAAKMKPKAYGDRTTLAGDPESPLAGPAVFAMTNEQLLAIAAGRGG